MDLLPLNESEYVNMRIVGGYNADPFEWGFIAAIHFYAMGFYYESKCAGSLIHPQWVVTSAQCLNNLNFYTSIKVSVAQTSKNRSVIDSVYTKRVDRFFIHEKYLTNKRRWRYDIAMLRLESPYDFEGKHKNASCISLPINEQIMRRYPEACMVLGWGDHFEDDKQLHYELQETHVALRDVHWCNGFSNAHYATQVCSGEIKSATDACTKDAGGPYVCAVGKRPDGIIEYTLVGIIVNPGCGDKPGIYTNVLIFKNWILKLIKDYTV